MQTRITETQQTTMEGVDTAGTRCQRAKRDGDERRIGRRRTASRRCWTRVPSVRHVHARRRAERAVPGVRGTSSCQASEVAHARRQASASTRTRAQPLQAQASASKHRAGGGGAPSPPLHGAGARRIAPTPTRRCWRAAAILMCPHEAEECVRTASTAQHYDAELAACGGGSCSSRRLPEPHAAPAPLKTLAQHPHSTTPRYVKNTHTKELSLKDHITAGLSRLVMFMIASMIIISSRSYDHMTEEDHRIVLDAPATQREEPAESRADTLSVLEDPLPLPSLAS